MLLDHDDIAQWRATPEGNASELVLSWPDDRPAPSPRRRAVTVRARASLGHLVHRWTFEAGQLPEEGELVVVPEIPVEAQLDPVVADYVVDLVLTIVVEGTPLPLDPVWLAWPDGLDGAPVLWTPEMGERFAPHGVLASEVVAFADEMGVEGRLLPPIYEERSRPPAQPLPRTNSHIDTGAGPLEAP